MEASAAGIRKVKYPEHLQKAGWEITAGTAVSDAVHACNIFVMPGGGCAFTIRDVAQTRRQLAERSCDL